jgi:DNA topoisomerase VI subunit B
MNTSQPAPELRRQVFTTSRELEYFSESELVTQTGYQRQDWWPGVLTKELVDNALDASEQSGRVPEIHVHFTSDGLTVTDNGPGISPDVVERLLDYSTRTSDKAAYVSPTRGAQGNALKTVLAIPYVLAGGRSSKVCIETYGLKHVLSVSTDHIARRPRIVHDSEQIVKTEGTSVHIGLDSACSNLPVLEPQFLQKLLFDYSLFNPHATLLLSQRGPESRFERTTPDWRKWLSTDPTSAHWYNHERLENLIASYMAAEREGGQVRTVREFVSEFRGLSGTAKQKHVAAEAGLERAYLRDLATDGGQLEHTAVTRLLSAMQNLSAPVKPEALGVLGEKHFLARLGTEAEAFRYKRITGIDDGLPYVVECAFAITSDPMLRGNHVGLNWSVPLSNPIQQNTFYAGQESLSGFSGLLASQHISVYSDPICLALHLVSPRFQFLDRGKGNVYLPHLFAEAVAKAILETTKEWAAVKKKAERDQRQAQRMRERISRARRVTVKEAAYDVIPAAYLKASGNGQYPANARQVMYAARPAIQESTGETLDDTYFTQTLLPNYQIEHPVETANWDIVYDARGHFYEPHTGREVPLGTIAVREYLSDIDEAVELDLPNLDLSSNFPTIGPLNRYGAVLLIEKEGFGPVLAKAQFAERYDLAVMSSKGMNTTAARKLVDCLPEQVPIFVLHDFDKAGFSILGTLTQDRRRYSYANAPRVIDLGLRLADVKKWKLYAEVVDYHKSDPRGNLETNGASPEEIAFLCDGKDWQGYHGKRVELNAFMSDEFVSWLELKLKQHGLKKIIPRNSVLQKEYRRQATIARLQAILDHARAEVSKEAAKLKPPRELRQTVTYILSRNPALPWDEAVRLALKSVRTIGGG